MKESFKMTRRLVFVVIAATALGVVAQGELITPAEEAKMAGSQQRCNSLPRENG